MLAAAGGGTASPQADLTQITLQEHDQMAGSFELKTAGTDSFRFALKAGNHQIILTSQTYASKASALNGIESVRTNSPLEARYDRRTSKAGEPYFVLLAGNGQIIGQSEMYSSPAAMENGIQSVMRNGADSVLKDLTAEA
jgi:uncharacterized protein YegP (UPF0339 family)